MNVELLRRRGGERGESKGDPPASSPPPSLLRMNLGRLRRAMMHPRTSAERIRLLFLFLIVFTLLLFIVLALFYLRPSFMFEESESAEAWLRRHIVCPTDILIGIPPPRRKTGSGKGGSADTVENRTTAFAYDVSRQNGIPGSPATLAGLEGFCAARVSAVPRWASGSWRTWRDAVPSGATGPQRSAIFNLTIQQNFLGNATYTAVGSPFCLAGGAFYVPQERINAGGMEVFTAEQLTVLPLTDAVLHNAAMASASAGLHVVPAMGLLLSGFWIATHFFHLITDALETLYGAFHTMEDGVLLHIPTQTVMVRSDATNWADRRGDRARKIEFSAALANSFASPLLKGGSPYNTSFSFRPDSPYCVGRDGERKNSATLAAGNAATAAGSAASAVCFCDGLLVTTHNHPYMNASIYYGIQDWAAQGFGAPPYVKSRSVRDMDRLRLAQSPSWAAQFWPEDATTTSFRPNATAAVSLYRPRVVFIHRTTRLIANAARYAEQMRAAGFRVAEVHMEQLSAAQQYHLGRYADVVVGMHGLGIGHALWMEREPYGCRTVIEFRPWVIQYMPLQPLRVLGETMQFHFVAIVPTDVRFGPSVKEPEKERELLMSVKRITNAFSFPSFTDQTAFYDDDEVGRVISAVHQHLSQCLPK